MTTRVHEYAQGREARTRFQGAVKTILSVPHAEMERREKEYQARQVLKPKRGPKPKAKASVSRDRGSDD
jgi:hypothetical protein